mgnify:CR=1 FL=1
MEAFPSPLESNELHDDDNSKIIEDLARSSFNDFADDIMSLYGSKQGEDKFETLSSTPISQLHDELDKVKYRILWLESILNESMLEQELISRVIESLQTPSKQ